MSSIKVRLKPAQGIKVGSSTVYVFDEGAIAEQVALAEDWAIKTDGQVNSEDYSSKAYAVGGTGTETNNSKYYAGQADTSATNAQTWAEGTDVQVAILGGQKSSKGWADRAKEIVDSIGSVLHYKGSVATYGDLPTSGQEIGDMYNILSDGSNYVWNGTGWDAISGVVDLSAYRTAADQDLIDAGFQAEITASNKLDADFVDDSTSTNKFVSSSDKTTWNGKQDAISDLNTIRSGASAGATAVQPGDLSTVATTGAYSDLSGTPTIPTDTSDLTNGAGFITGIDSTDVTTALGYTPADGSSLATVATSGDYGDLLNTPTIPTVNDATLTMQQNGTTLDTFTANSSTNVTVNIQTPTKSNILGWVLPDYSSKITTTVGTNTTYTCPSAGFITLVVNNSLTQGGILINDVAPQGSDKLYVDGQYFVDQGDIIKASGFTSQTLVFFPLKGV